ncbi:hypothetical protein SAY86_030956 [Trapa natans]|uniref:Uncharacterized protein n=1 Tax=Trapa natans TaxID=22666 RepID=A0AAN7M3Q4_TRANT|nr:hypothetical protein SAY86_030956 [Trapa natans]
MRCTARSSVDSQPPTVGSLSDYFSPDVGFVDSPAGFGLGSGDDSGISAHVLVSSSVGHEWFPDTREPRSRKRKRGTEMKLQLAHMENWVSSLMEKQEQMLKQLMEMIEDQEKERIARVKFLRLHAFARMILKMVRATRCNNGTPIYSGSIISCFSSVWGYFLLDILGSC